MTTVPLADVPLVRNAADFHSGLTLNTYYLAPNLGKDSQCQPISCAPFNDLHFRLALRDA